MVVWPARPTDGCTSLPTKTKVLGHALRRRDRHHRRCPRRLLGSGGAAAPERESLALLPSGPDAVRTLPVRGTRSSTPRAPILSRRTVPRAFGPAWSGFRVQGTADSPPSAAEREEGTTSIADYDRRSVIEATLFSDAACPWAYSANPALRVLEWRYREQLEWRLVMIGLRDEVSEASVRAHDPERVVARQRVYMERYGMPFGLVPKSARPRAGGDAGPSWARRSTGERIEGVPRAPARELHARSCTSTTTRGSVRHCAASTGSMLTRIVDASRCSGGQRGDDATRTRRGRPQDLRRTPKTRRRRRTVRCDSRRRPCLPAGRPNADGGRLQPLLAYDVLLANLDTDLEPAPAARVRAGALRVLPRPHDDGGGRLLLADGPDPIPHHV